MVIAVGAIGALCDEQVMRWRALSCVALALLLTGCVSITPDGERVRVVRNANYVKDCKSLGEVTSRSAWGGMMTEVGYESDSRALRNDTAARGGNTVLIHTEREGFGTYTRGEAFRCQ
jgi:uncharacterized protein DUF4156